LLELVGAHSTEEAIVNGATAVRREIDDGTLGLANIGIVAKSLFETAYCSKTEFTQSFATNLFWTAVQFRFE
jgi:hypothetical protein